MYKVLQTHAGDQLGVSTDVEALEPEEMQNILVDLQGGVNEISVIASDEYAL